MRIFNPSFEESFEVIGNTQSSQVAEMTLPPGKKVGGEDNMHQSDQWLFVLSGKGKAVVADETVDISRGNVLLIEKGERHSVECASDNEPLRTLNFYAPPEFEPPRN